MKIYDIAIIGGGVVGTAIAQNLAKYNLTICLLEKYVELAFGVSKSNSGIIHPGTQNPPHSLKGKLCVEGNRLIRKLAKELGVHFEEVGELIVITDPLDLPKLKKLKIEGELLGVKKLKIVNQAWLRKHEPNLSKEVIAALYAPTCGIISPYRLTYALAENAQANGVEIYTNSLVTNISKDEHFKIDTSNGVFLSRYVINAAGLYADEIAKMVGINDFSITPRKGEEYLLDMKLKGVTNHIIFPLPTKTSKGTLIIKTSDGNPMIGPTAEDTNNKEDKTTTDAGLKKVLENVKKLVPCLSEKDIIAYFAGLRPVAGEDFIIRAEKNPSGMITVAGIQSPGLTAAPAIAKFVEKLLRENGLALKKKSKFKKHRPAPHHLFALPFSKISKLIHKNPNYGDIVCRCEMVSAQEIREAIQRGAKTMDGIKFRTRAQAGRCHGGFCTTRIMKILAEELKLPITKITKRGPGSEIVLEERK